MIISSISTCRPLIGKVNTISQKHEDNSSVSFASAGNVPAYSTSNGCKLKRGVIGGILFLMQGCSSGGSADTVASKLLAIWNAADIPAAKLPGKISYRTKIGTREYELNKVCEELVKGDGSFNPNDVRYKVTPTNIATGMKSREYLDRYSDVPDAEALIQGTNLEDVKIEGREGRMYSTDPKSGEVIEIFEKDRGQEGLLHVLDPSGNVKSEITDLKFDDSPV